MEADAIVNMYQRLKFNTIYRNVTLASQCGTTNGFQFQAIVSYFTFNAAYIYISIQYITLHQN